MSVDTGGGNRDEMDVVLPMDLTKSGPTFEIATVVRVETVRAGQRYRYGGEFLVPLDAPEEVPAGSIMERSVPRNVGEAVCSDCSSDESAELPFVVFVDAAGNVRSLRILKNEASLKGHRVTPKMIASAEKAIRGWSFSPARTKGKAISDWCFVRVSVRGRVQR